MSTSDTSHYENVPFEIPEGWCWCTVGGIVYDLKYGTSKKSSALGDVPVLRMGNLTRKGTISYDNLVYTSDLSDIAEYELTKGDLLFNRTNSSDWVGKTALYDGKVKSIYAGYLVRVRAIIVNSEYLNIVMNSQYYRDWCFSVKTDAVNQSNINANKLASFSVPIPPLTEQNRIVREVMKMTELVEQIEQGVLDIQSFIGDVKAKILDLAIHGKLVPQDPNDEPASELLKRINPKAVASCDNPHYEQVPFEIPDNWAWVSIDEINKFKSKSVNPQNNPTAQFELYSVPTFETGEPEYPFGKDVASSKVEVVEGDVLLCKINPHLNRVWVVRRRMAQMKSLASSEWIVIRTDEILPEYLALTMQSPYFRELMMSNVSGVGGSLMRAQPTFVKQYKIPIPPICEQKRIVTKIQETFNTLDSIAGSLN